MTAPAAMPGEEDVARALCKDQHYDPDFDYDPHGIYDRPGCNVRWKLYQGQARAVLDIFAPILAEKERRDALDREQAETVRFLQHHLDNPQPPSEALKKLFADYQAAGVQSVGLDSPFNACCYRDHCKALEARALAAEAENRELRKQMLADEGQHRDALAAERERCALIAERFMAAGKLVDGQFYAGPNTPRAIAAAIRAQGE